MVSFLFGVVVGAVVTVLVPKVYAFVKGETDKVKSKL